MCGIAGIVAKRPVNVTAVERMTSEIRHRGPDGEGIWADGTGKTVFGHRRLAVIDPTPDGTQPMVDGSGRFVLNFNGEIYNYKELASDLRSEGVEFRSRSDSEVLLEAYKKWGEACLQRLNGMFAFAIYDMEKRTVFCARDRFGEKPFLFSEQPEYLAFASEYKALLTLQGVGAEVDHVRLVRFLHEPRQGLDDGRETVFSGVKQLLPGEWLRLDIDTLGYEIGRYRDVEPDEATAALKPQDAAYRFRELLIDSVRIRMRSDVAVGSCLSGGLDSSSIVAINRQLIGAAAPYHVFTGRFPGTSADEGEFAEAVISKTSVEAHETQPSPVRFLGELAEFVWFNELPVGSTSQYAQWCVFRLAVENGVTVLLDGQGADELLAGCEQFFGHYLEARAGQGDGAALSEERQAIEKRYPLALAGGATSWKTRIPKGLRWALADLTGKGSDLLFGVEKGLARRASEANQRSLDRRFHALAAALKDEALHAHLPTLLRYGDRNSMAHSREVRLPFCDHRLAEFSLSLAPQVLMGHAETKHLLRSAMADLLPERIATRWNKQGFLPPQADWFHGPLGDRMADVLAGSAFRSRGIWNVSWWERALHRFQDGADHLSWVLWRPLMTEAWFEHFVDRSAARERTDPLQGTSQ